MSPTAGGLSQSISLFLGPKSPKFTVSSRINDLYNTVRPPEVSWESSPLVFRVDGSTILLPQGLQNKETLQILTDKLNSHFSILKICNLVSVVNLTDEGRWISSKSRPRYAASFKHFIGFSNPGNNPSFYTKQNQIRNLLVWKYVCQKFVTYSYVVNGEEAEATRELNGISHPHPGKRNPKQPKWNSTMNSYHYVIIQFSSLSFEENICRIFMKKFYIIPRVKYISLCSSYIYSSPRLNRILTFIT